MKRVIFFLLAVLVIIGCNSDVKPLSEVDIYISVLSEPPEADVYLSIESKHSDVKSIKKSKLGRTPLRRAKVLSIPGLNSKNARFVNLVLETNKNTYYNRVEEIDFRIIQDVKEISFMYYLNKKEDDVNELTRPIPPGNVKASNGTYKDYVQITWDKLDDARNYYVFRDSKEDGKFKEKLALVKGQSFLDRTAEPGKEYYYKIQAENSVGYSDLSKAAKGFIKEKSKEEEENEKKDKSPSGSGDGIPLPKASVGGGDGIPSPTGISPGINGGAKGAERIIKNISG